jgi:hypothetical protein
MWRRIDLEWTDVSEERVASIFSVEESASEEPVWANHRCENLKSFIVYTFLGSCVRYFLLLLKYSSRHLSSYNLSLVLHWGGYHCITHADNVMNQTKLCVFILGTRNTTEIHNYGLKLWAGFIWLRIGSGGLLLVLWDVKLLTSRANIVSKEERFCWIWLSVRFALVHGTFL